MMSILTKSKPKHFRGTKFCACVHTSTESSSCRWDNCSSFRTENHYPRKLLQQEHEQKIVKFVAQNRHTRDGSRRSSRTQRRQRRKCQSGVTDQTGTNCQEISVVELVAWCVALAESAGLICKEVAQGGELTIVDKGGSKDISSGEYVADYQTAADRRSEALITSELRKKFGAELVIIGEESVSLEESGVRSVDMSVGSEDGVKEFTGPSSALRREISSRSWPEELRSISPPSRVVVFIDPLDGTMEFASANYGVVTNLIGISVDGIPVAGIINQPFYNYSYDRKSGHLSMITQRTVWGGPGAGVHGDVNMMHRSNDDDAEKLTAATNRIIRDDRIHQCLAAIGVQDTSWISASGFNLLQVLENRRSFMIIARDGTKKWDTCAGGKAVFKTATICSYICRKCFCLHFYTSLVILHARN